VNIRRGRWFWLIALLLVGTAVRVYDLAELPPGPFHDEAYNGLDARALLEGQEFPIFHDTWETYADIIHAERAAQPTRWPVYFEGNYGREPLHIYITAILFRFLGVSDWALRIGAAVGGLVAVCIAAPMARELLGHRRDKQRQLGLIAVFAAAGIYPLLSFSRLGLRAIWLVVCEGVAITGFWRAWRTNRVHAWAAAGVAMGLVQYTYGAARLLPIVVAAFVIVQAVAKRRLPRERLAGLAVMALASIVVATPLLLFFIRYPAYLSLRTSVIAVDEPGSGLAFWVANGLKALSGLVWHGDVNPLLNLPGRAFLDPVQVVLALVGLIVALRRLARPIAVFLILWSAAMLVPSALIGHAPHFGRSLGIAWPLVMLIVLGVEALGAVLPVRAVRWATPGLAGLLACSVALSTWAYFGPYAKTPDLYHEFKAHLADVGRFARQLPAETTLYLTPPQKYYAGVLFELGDSARIADFYGPAGAWPVGILGRPTAYLVMSEDRTSPGELEGLFPAGRWITQRTDFAAYGVPAGAGPAPAHLLAATFGDSIQLVGVDGLSDLTGSSLTIRFHWQALKQPPDDYTVFLHLVGPDGNLADQMDRPPHYATGRWRPGEVVLDTYTVRLPERPLSGTYQLLTGFYDDNVTRLPVACDGVDQPSGLVALVSFEMP
jgi:4-amino-4-deoxy-L-arabinose transferase-like glycosyltransferase